MPPRVERVTQNTGYHRAGCLCCPKGPQMPYLPGEKKWERYLLPGAIIAAFGIGVAVSIYYHHKSESNPRSQARELSDRAKTP